MCAQHTVDRTLWSLRQDLYPRKPHSRATRPAENEERGVGGSGEHAALVHHGYLVDGALPDP